MKKILSLFAAILFAGSMMADSYTITFKDGGADSDKTSSLTSTNVADYVDAGAEYVSAIAPTGKVYLAKAGAGLKFGNTSGGGSVTLTLAAAIKPTSIVVSASQFGASEGSGIFQGQTFDMTAGGGKYSFNDYTVTYDGNTEVETISVGTAKRGYVKSITVNYTAGGDPEPTHTYTVAGSSDVAFGTTWAPANTANDMVKQDNGTYKWEKTDLTLPAGAIEFKVCEDHDWKVSYPAQNYSLNIAEAGIYTITITFDPAAESDKVAAVATKTGEAVVVPSVAMHGNFTGDKWADTENFALADNKESASLKLTLAAGNYEFGMRIGGSGNWTSNGVSFTRENASAVVEAGEGNLKLAADEAGDYTFTWTFADNKLTITFPEKKLTPVPEENYIIHWDADAEKVIGNVILHAGAEIGSAKIHTNTDNETGIKLTSSYVYAEDKYVVLKLANGKFKAGDVIEIATFFNNSDETKYGRVRFYAADGATQLFETKDAINGRLVNDDPVLEQFVLEAEQDSILLGRYGNTGVFITKLNVGREGGAPEPVLANGYYLIGQNGWDVAALNADLLFAANPENEGEFQLSVTLVKDEGVKVVEVENDAIKTWFPEGMGNEYKVDEAHAGEVTIYFRPEGNSDWADFGGFMYVAKNAATAISNTAVEAKAQKMIQNGQLFILRDGKIYTVQGMQVK